MRMPLSLFKEQDDDVNKKTRRKTTEMRFFLAAGSRATTAWGEKNAATELAAAATNHKNLVYISDF